MDTLQRLIDISNRLDHLENAAEWIAKDTVHTNNSASQTATLITALADDVREKLYALVQELEQNMSDMVDNLSYH